MNRQELVLRASIWALFAVFAGTLAAIFGLPIMGGLMLGAIAFPVIGPFVTGGIGNRSAAATEAHHEVGAGTAVYMIFAVAVCMTAILALIWLLRLLFSK